MHACHGQFLRRASLLFSTSTRVYHDQTSVFCCRCVPCTCTHVALVCLLLSSYVVWGCMRWCGCAVQTYVALSASLSSSSCATHTRSDGCTYFFPAEPPLVVCVAGVYAISGACPHLFFCGLCLRACRDACGHSACCRSARVSLRAYAGSDAPDGSCRVPLHRPPVLAKDAFMAVALMSALACIDGDRDTRATTAVRSSCTAAHFSSSPRRGTPCMNLCSPAVCARSWPALCAPRMLLLGAPL